MPEIISSILSDQNAMRLEINYKKKKKKTTNSWKLNNMLLNNKWIIEEIKEEVKRYLDINDNEDTAIQKQSKTYGTQQKQF